MMKNPTWIKGRMPRQKSPANLEETWEGATTFWHIKRPRSSQMVGLCGVRPLKAERFKKTKKELEPRVDQCGFCVRIARGLDPVFQSSNEDEYRIRDRG